ncbi:MAG: hypothetical protein ABSE83_10155 [Methanobacterium sp.]|jgi:hypothetical protein
MDRKILRNIILIIVGVILLVVSEFKLIQLPEFLNLLLGLIGFVILIDGIYELYKILKQ